MIFIQILIVLVILAYGWAGYRRGFFSQLFDLLGIVFSLLIALHFYNAFSMLFQNLGVNPNLVKPLGFFILWILAQALFYILVYLVFRYLLKNNVSTDIGRFLGILPGIIKGMLMVAIILMMFLILPVPVFVKDNLSDGSISGPLIRVAARLKPQADNIFGDMKSLSLFTTVNQNEEMIKLDFKIEDYTIDETSERAMVDLVNQERKKAGLNPLKVDNTIRGVARLHSIDMVKKGYFSHTNLDGKTPAQRMTEGGVDFWLAGENIALAPTYEMAQIGFLKSPKHYENIVDSKFNRIGIGIIDTGVYGRMVTQNFAD